MPRIRDLATAILVLSLACLAVAEVPADPAAGAGPIRLQDVPGLKQAQAERLREGARERQERLRLAREAGRHLGAPRGRGARPRPSDADGAVDPGHVVRHVAISGRLESTQTFPPNVRVNDPTGEGFITQSEEHVAFSGGYGLASWNDGVGPNYQGFATSTDGGATWHDRGTLQIASGGGNWRGDPVVTVDEKSGTFYVAGLYFPTGSTSAIGVARGRFAGGVFGWENVAVVHTVSQSTDFLDKEWIVADSLSGNLYLTYTHFTATGDSIVFQRSTDQGATWGPMLPLNSVASVGFVQGSRPAVGPNGEVYVEWFEIGTVDADFWWVAKSTDFGVSFGAPVLAGAGYSNYGTGAPGFNRFGGIQFAGIAVDRSDATTRGRVYVTWPEAVDYYADDLGTVGAKIEVEPNSAAATATPFVPGAILRGAYGSTSDVDWWSFPAIAGKSYVFYSDSSRSSLFSMQVMCSDQVTSLALSGDNYFRDVGTVNLFGLVVWTAPTSGTYYLRMAFINNSPSLPRGYRVFTGVHVPNLNDRARDARDIAVASSAAGTAFGPPSRPDDDPVGFDDWLPEVAVARDGMAYLAWFDWRDILADCGGASNTYLTRSTDGGVTWAPNIRVTDTRTPWTFVGSNLAPNQGDYMGMYGGHVLSVLWADGRSGDPDVYSATLEPGYSVTCHTDTMAVPGAMVGIPLDVTNHNAQFSNQYRVGASDQRGWLAGSPPVPVTANAGQTAFAQLNIAVPDTAAAGPNRITLAWRMSDGALPETCSFILDVNPLVGVGPGGPVAFGLRALDPNPAVGDVAIRFALPVAGPATLELLDLAGRRVLEREIGSFGPGVHTLSLRGELARLPAGVYSVRLRQREWVEARKLILMR